MMMSGRQKALIKELKKKIHRLQKSEEQTRKKMKQALNQAKQLALAYQSKLVKKSKEMQRKIEAAQASGYAKAFSDVKKRVKKHLRSKAKTVISILCPVNKKPTSKRKQTGPKKK